MDAEETLQQRRRRLAQVSRACEACRMRKIRCDRSNPCSNCRTAGLACQVVNSRTDSGPKRDRIAQLEERVKYLHDRLFTAQTQLNSHHHTTPNLANPSSSTLSRNDQHGPFAVDDTRVYEGSSSFRNQAVQASDISQSKVVTSGVHTQHNMDCLTRQLSNLLQPSDLRASAEDYQFASSATSNNQPAMDLLPSGLVVAILQQIRVNRPIFLCSFIISDPSLLESLCRQAYYTSTSLSLGQATAMSSPDPEVRPWDELLIMAIKFAKLQGRVYDQLYSATARNAQPMQQAETIEEFSAKLQSWYTELCEIDSTKMKQPEVFELSQKSWDITYYSTMTLILIKAPTTEEETGVSQACLQAARAGLRCHLACFSSYQTADSPGLVSEGEYASWVLHQSSLNPFIAVFLYAIAADSLEDLSLLDEVVAVLEKISVVSNGCQDLFKVCSTFARLGRALVMNDTRLENPEGGLQLSNDPISGPPSGLETFEGIFGEGMLEQLSNYESYNFSALLGSWTNDEMGVVDEAQK
ncbi:hypothetical protein CDV36_002906 [Fusarium kuroshium]|uniref:Zn(2)-C6 fungal-type domain-containing protein n=1 Tax=Fusarium kuroshium TaxID=2010991 RepID=A0A3M2SJF7_9HYPO|nr:hypothetical protein CDV36_002906 [Fusarium kuroshium]